MTMLGTPSLFPPPGAIKEPLPLETVNVAQKLLTELLVVVIENDLPHIQSQLVPEGEHHE
jgi:hypothetical protein